MTAIGPGGGHGVASKRIDKIGLYNTRIIKQFSDFYFIAADSL